ncbi:microsomal glutathione S-transferase 1-like [Anneissia japonica]|uniref:microsomal glutathione S-transferase 1-like n=1 Tax=Anneissia japonica TaxID=1529436 RepID=UPI00142588E6|nr:microsomal glutathione S-transferase 1-like [Anneissia japonica]
MSSVYDNDVFRLFCTYAGMTTMKMMLLSFYTSRFRFKNDVFASPEDRISKSSKIGANIDEDVERVRRCHLNDLENIVPFLFLGFLYALSEPSVFAASMHYRIFFASRVLHSIAYLAPLPQPSRAFCFTVGWIVNASMAWNVIKLGMF